MLKWFLLLAIIGLGVLIYRQAVPDIQRYMRIRNM